MLPTSRFSKNLILYNILMISFYTNPALPGTIACKFSSGLKQNFPPKICAINSTLYRTDDLTTLKEDYYPIVLTIEAIYPPEYKGRAKKCMQITYGQFVQETPGNLKFKFLKQKFLVRAHI
jgi:hypothetical protein